MKRLWIAASLLLAATASAEWQTVLTDENTVWSANGQSISVKLDLMRRDGDLTTTVRVPGTEDAVIESNARLAWDSTTRVLFVMWRHGDDIRVVLRDDAGKWSEPAVVVKGASLEGLQLVLTRASDTTLLHAAWWSGQTAEYALLAFNRSELLSSYVTTLDQLANVHAAIVSEDTGAAVHPPLAMARAGEGVDVAYGAPHSTAITTLTIKPEKHYDNARMWRPSGRSGRRTEPAGLVSLNTSAVGSFIVDGRIVLYTHTPDARFRYVVSEKDRWTPIRLFTLDEQFTRDDLLRELRRSVREYGSDNEPANQ